MSDFLFVRESEKGLCTFTMPHHVLTPQAYTFRETPHTAGGGGETSADQAHDRQTPAAHSNPDLNDGQQQGPCCPHSAWDPLRQIEREAVTHTLIYMEWYAP